MTPDVYRKLFKEIRTAVIAAEIGRLMFEYEAAHALTPEETFDLINELITVLPGMSIALVCRDPRHRPSLHFGATVRLGAGEERRSFTDPPPRKNGCLTIRSPFCDVLLTAGVDNK